MNLSEVGQSRMRGYLFVLRRSLEERLPAAMVDDAVREIESHLLDRIAEAEPLPDERAALESVIARFGQPMRVARAYSAEIVVEEAVRTRRVLPVLRGLWLVAASTTWWFFAGLAFFVGYILGVSLIGCGIACFLAPDMVGLNYRGGALVGIGYQPGSDVTVVSPPWLAPALIGVGAQVTFFTHLLARAALRAWQGRQILRWRRGPASEVDATVAPLR